MKELLTEFGLMEFNSVTNMQRTIIAAQHIIAIESHGTGTRICLSNGKDALVRQSYEETLALWKEALDDEDHRADDPAPARTGIRNKR